MQIRIKKTLINKIYDYDIDIQYEYYIFRIYVRRRSEQIFYVINKLRSQN